MPPARPESGAAAAEAMGFTGMPAPEEKPNPDAVLASLYKSARPAVELLPGGTLRSFSLQASVRVMVQVLQ